MLVKDQYDYGILLIGHGVHLNNNLGKIRMYPGRKPVPAIKCCSRWGVVVKKIVTLLLGLY